MDTLNMVLVVSGVTLMVGAYMLGSARGFGEGAQLSANLFKMHLDGLQKYAQIIRGLEKAEAERKEPEGPSLS